MIKTIGVNARVACRQLGRKKQINVSNNLAVPQLHNPR